MMNFAENALKDIKLNKKERNKMNKKYIISTLMFVAMAMTSFIAQAGSPDRPNNYIYTDDSGVIYELEHGGADMDLTGRDVTSRDMVTQAELDALNLTSGTNGTNGVDGKDGRDGIDGTNGTNGIGIRGAQGARGYFVEGISGAGIAGGVAMIEDKGFGGAITGGGGNFQMDVFAAMELNKRFKVGAAFSHAKHTSPWINNRNRVTAFGVVNF